MDISRISSVLLCAAAAFLTACGADPLAAQSDADSDAHRLLCELKTDKVRESSGLALSRRNPGLFWTHNDSGGEPRLFAFDRSGELRATVTMRGAEAVDWEDMTAARIDEEPCLIVGDTGDNARRRNSYSLYIIAEPRIDDGPETDDRVVKVRRHLQFNFDNGAQNCEAIAWLPGESALLLASKHRRFRSDIYRLALPEGNGPRRLKARRIARLPIPVVTSMDVSRDGRRLILCNYWVASEYERGKKEPWSEDLQRQATLVILPPRQQGESIAYGDDGQKLYLTSEGTPMPLWEVRLESFRNADKAPAGR